MIDRIELRLDPLTRLTRPKIAGPKMPGEFLGDAEEPEKLARFSRGIRLANSERLSACVPPCTTPTRIARIRKCVSVFMKYPKMQMIV